MIRKEVLAGNSMFSDAIFLGHIGSDPHLMSHEQHSHHGRERERNIISPAISHFSLLTRKHQARSFLQGVALKVDYNRLLLKEFLNFYVFIYNLIKLAEKEDSERRLLFPHFITSPSTIIFQHLSWKAPTKIHLETSIGFIKHVLLSSRLKELLLSLSG